MKLLFLLLILVGCASKPLSQKNIQELPPTEVAQRGSESDIFQKAKFLVNANDMQGFIQLVQAVANINARNNVGDTLLHIAVDAKDPKAVKEVLKKKPDLNVLNNFHYTPLMLAVAQGERESAKILLQAGADPNITDGFDMNCLIRAAYHEDLPMINLLIQYKVMPFVDTKYGRKRASEVANWESVKKTLLKYEDSFEK